MIRMAMRTAVIISSKEGFESIFHALLGMQQLHTTMTHFQWEIRQWGISGF